ncbi:hypothetical protein AAMO2058_000615700 [Amorphochlora amoebiformis]
MICSCPRFIVMVTRNIVEKCFGSSGRGERAESARGRASGNPFSLGKGDGMKPHFGDLMGFEGNVDATSLDELTGEEIMLLTANGNLQRIVSAYYNQQVLVDIIVNERIGLGKYRRRVKLTCTGRVFCVADSVVEIFDEEMRKTVEKGGIGIGQLFRAFNILPRFRLLAFSKSRLCSFTPSFAHQNLPRGEKSLEPDEEIRPRLRRLYELNHSKLTCRIFETFTPNFMTHKARSEGMIGGKENNFGAETGETKKERYKASRVKHLGHFGDIMAGTKVAVLLPDHFNPIERVLITANGNLQRLLASYLKTSVGVRILQTKRTGKHVFVRDVVLEVGFKPLVTAKNTVTITDDRLLARIDAGEVEKGRRCVPCCWRDSTLLQVEGSKETDVQRKVSF